MTSVRLMPSKTSSTHRSTICCEEREGSGEADSDEPPRTVLIGHPTHERRREGWGGEDEED